MALPSPKKTLTWLVLADVTIWTLAVIFGKTPATYMAEGKLISFVSAAHLVAIGVISFALYRRRQAQEAASPTAATSGPGKSFRLWLLTGLGFLFLAVDELAQGHEHIDDLIHWLFQMQPTLLTSRLDDLIVLLYGVSGLAVLIYYRREWKQVSGFKPYLAAGFILFLLMVAVDMGTSRMDLLNALFPGKENYMPVYKWLNAIEEGFKVLAEAMLVGAFYSCLASIAQTGNEHSPDSQ